MIKFNGRVVRCNGGNTWLVSYSKDGGNEQTVLVDLNNLVRILTEFLVNGYNLIVAKELDELDERIRVWRQLHLIV